MVDRPSDPGPTIVDLLRGSVLDAELAGLVWLLLDGGVPVVVVGPDTTPAAITGRAAVLAALVDLIPSSRVQRPLDGPTEDFSWIAAAEALGWQRSGSVDPAPLDPRSTVIRAGELGGGPSADTTGDQARLVVRALGLGFGLTATAEGARLEDLLASLRRRPVGLTDDELTNLGVVVVLGGSSRATGSTLPTGPGAGLPRIAAAHYIRPLARDVHGHPQRLGPAVLATWDGRLGRFEHFAWGVAGELAARVGRRTGDFELERERRSVVLTGLAADDAGPPAPDRATVRAALERARFDGSIGTVAHEH